MAPVARHVPDAKRDVNVQRDPDRRVYLPETIHRASLDEERDVGMDQVNPAKKAIAVVFSNVEDQERMHMGKRGAKRLHLWLALVPLGTLVVLFALAAVIHFVLGWTLDDDCFGCK